MRFFDALDAQNIEVDAKKSKEWFKKELSGEALAATLYRHSLSKDPTGRFEPLLRLKINGPGSLRGETRIFVAEPTSEGGMKYVRGTIDDCPPNSHVTPIVQLGGMWFISKGFGMGINCTDLLVYPAKQQTAAFPFQISDPTGQEITVDDITNDTVNDTTLGSNDTANGNTNADMPDAI